MMVTLGASSSRVEDIGGGFRSLNLTNLTAEQRHKLLARSVVEEKVGIEDWLGEEGLTWR